MWKACGCNNTQTSTVPRAQNKFILKIIKKCSHLLQRESALKWVSKASLRTSNRPRVTLSLWKLFLRNENAAHALIKKRFLFIRQHATQQQAQTILRIIAESEAPEGNESDTEWTNEQHKKSSQNVDTDDDSEKFSTRSFILDDGLRRKAWKALNYMKIYFFPHPQLPHSLIPTLLFTASLLSYTSHFQLDYTLKTRKPKYVESKHNDDMSASDIQRAQKIHSWCGDETSFTFMYL